MAVRDMQPWQDFLLRARWFQGKGLPIDGIEWHALPWQARDGDVWVRSELAEVRSGAGQPPDVYHLLVGYLPCGHGEPDALIGRVELPGRGWADAVDAPHSPTAMQALLRGITEPGCAGVEWLDQVPDPCAETRVFAGEQSNTTVQVGDSVLFKIFRKLSPGPSLESESLAALAHCDITPGLIGTWATTDGAYQLGLFSQRISDAEDGWGWCVGACRDGRDISAEMSGLGATLRRLHTEFAAVFGTSTIDAATIGQQMLGRLDAAVAQVPELAECQTPLRAVLGLPSSQVEVQRVHGDFHLGQALISPRGWTIIDFEGEPLKTPAERAAHDTVWRDVAGLLRSLDYARSHHRDPAGEDAVGWYRAARAAFLDGYLASVVEPPSILTAYEVDKAIYELVYETRNRPTWSWIPRQAIIEAIG